MVRRRKKFLKRVMRIGLVIFVTALVLFFVFSFYTKTNNSKKVLSVSTPGNFQGSVSLKKAVDEALDGSHGSYSVVIKNLKTGEYLNLNETQQFQSGSLYKLWVMAEAFQQIQDKTLDPDEILTEDVDVLNDKFNIATDEAELSDGTITVTVRDALNQMITISHNYDALILSDKIKLTNIADFLDKNNFKNSKIGLNSEAPVTTAADIALFLEDLYQGKLANQALTDQMLDLLKKQQLNDKLPKYLPEGVTVAHKTGELDAYTHDGGIVYSPKGDYVIVVLSRSDLPDAADERIANLSKNVYQYFSK